MPSRRAAVLTAAGTLAATVPMGAVLANTPDDLPAAGWASSCTAPESVYCVESATLTPDNGSATPLAGLGLTAAAATVTDEYGKWLRWTVGGWAGQPATVTGGTVRLVIRTGPFVPRFSNVTAAGFSMSRTVSNGKYTLTLTGRPTPVAWTGDADCTAGLSCGDTDTTADPTTYRFEGRTQDLDGFAGAYATALDGAHLATNAQARSGLPIYDQAAQPPLTLGVLGNPQLDATGSAVRNFIDLFLPGGYFTAAGTTPAAAVSTGLDLVTGGAVHQRVTVSLVDGGVRVQAPDLGPGAELAGAAYYHRPSTPTGRSAPGAPRTVTGTGGDGTVMTRWQAPADDGGSPVTGYRVRVYQSAAGDAALASCETAMTSCTIDDLVAGGVYHVAVSAVNALGEGAPGGRVEVRAVASPTPSPTVPAPDTAPSATPDPTPSAPSTPIPGIPAQPSVSPTGAEPSPDEPSGDPPAAPRAIRLTPGVRKITVTWAGPASDGGSPVTGYTARAYRTAAGTTQVAGCTATGGRNSCVLTGLTAGVRLYVAVTAENAAGISPEAVRAAATVWAVPGAPRSVDATSSHKRITVRWTPPADTGGTAITGYRAELKSGSLTVRCTAPATGRSCTVKGLKAGRTYTVRVRAVNAAGVSAPSTADKVKVKS
ncbi:hypothetical protein BJY16_007692 [Actinoplanes octamycinicus]|uniref:Fibronectin type-III domain-containing protein n=1 Tax=Actinoplanes octamycinicus TaxID=135948 RepID=A0A7W7H5E9_9ACTN|nr:fibronectin type III domain-containing protein [Actinoplanes octamycinicus]MBB4744233.1 hypothetical protein [Actinoplanes octamycinicus]GIE56809.1 hypothetical protein Aoc01nite_22110 [Actinoplanes octamycinicus]